MDSNTVRLLNQLNQHFYSVVGAHFDTTRSAPWPGWSRCLPYIKKAAARLQALSVFDVGCGNGRFGLFLHEAGVLMRYTGLDNTHFLLHKAAQKFPQGSFLQADALQTWPLAPGQRFDVIALFGVLHHVPGFVQRQQLITRMVDRLQPGGLGIVTLWKFMEQARFRERVVPWQAAEVPPAYHNLQLEQHDYLLRWKQHEDTLALRYCHYVDATEQAQLFGAWPILAEYQADTANHYLIIQRPAL